MTPENQKLQDFTLRRQRYDAQVREFLNTANGIPERWEAAVLNLDLAEISRVAQERGALEVIDVVLLANVIPLTSEIFAFRLQWLRGCHQGGEASALLDLAVAVCDLVRSNEAIAADLIRLVLNFGPVEHVHKLRVELTSTLEASRNAWNKIVTEALSNGWVVPDELQ